MIKSQIEKLINLKDDLRCLSISAIKLFGQNLKFERLQIDKEVAEEMFKYNK
jgi:hypothetical protein